MWTWNWTESIARIIPLTRPITALIALLTVPVTAPNTFPTTPPTAWKAFEIAGMTRSVRKPKAWPSAGQHVVRDPAERR